MFLYGTGIQYGRTSCAASPAMKAGGGTCWRSLSVPDEFSLNVPIENSLIGVDGLLCRDASWQSGRPIDRRVDSRQGHGRRGGQNWGAHDDTRPSSTGLSLRDRPGDGQGCEDHRRYIATAWSRRSIGRDPRRRAPRSVKAYLQERSQPSAAERPAPAARGSRPRLRRRLYAYRLPAPVRPPRRCLRSPFETRRPPGTVDFAQFQVIFAAIRMFHGSSAVLLVLGSSRWLWRASSCIRTCRRSCAAHCGVRRPRRRAGEILYDR